MIKKTLVLGASESPARYSRIAVQRLMAAGHGVSAVGKKRGNIDDLVIYTEKRKFKNIHTITLYLKKDYQPEFYDYIIELNPKRVIFNPGTKNPELEVLLAQHHIDFESACTLTLLSLNTY